MIYVTGDTHADFRRLSTQAFQAQKRLNRKDYLIICGDFGGIWSYGESNSEEKYWLDWLSKKPFTLLFVDGNHENYDRLNHFPSDKYHGGRAHKIRENIYHLMRGYVFTFDRKKIFTFGGASSHDIQDGILEPDHYRTLRDLAYDYRRRTSDGEMLRINHYSWWKEELPSETEMKRGIRELSKHDFKVDYVVSHCLPQSVAASCGFYKGDSLTRYFDSLINDYGLQFEKWYCGHYHTNRQVFNQYIIKYKEIERII